MTQAASLARLDKQSALRTLDTLGKQGDGAALFAACLSAFDHPVWTVRKQAAALMARIGKNPQVVEALKNAYNSGTIDQRYWIMRVLAQLVGAECLPWIRKIYAASKDSSVRTHALSAASEIPGADSSEFLVASLMDDSWLNRQTAAGYLEARGKDVLPLLQRGFTEGSGDLKYWCLRLLVRILGSESRATIKKGMKNDDPNIRHYVLRSLEDAEGNWVIPFLVEFLGDANWSNRRVAANILKSRGRPSLKYLAEACQAGTSDVRFWALHTLGETGDERAVGPLENFLYNCDDPEEGLWALEALGKLPAAAACRSILEASYEYPEHTEKIREILVRMGVIAVRPLIEYLDSPNDTIRGLCRRVMETLELPGMKPLLVSLESLGPQDREQLLHDLKQIQREELEGLFQKATLGIEDVRRAAAQAPPRAFPTMSTVSVTIAGNDPALLRARSGPGGPREVAEDDEPAAPVGRESVDVPDLDRAPAPRGRAPGGAVQAVSAGSDYPLALTEVLARAVRLQASDVHLKPGLAPIFRIHGNLRQTDLAVMSREATHAFALEVLPPLQRDLWAKGAFEMDAAYDAGTVGRFRVNCYQELQGTCIAMRHVPGKVSTLADLKLPRVFRDLCMLEQGLVLVTGPTGSGKSTTLAAMVDFINTHQESHIITIEDPVEFVHQNRMSVITNRELGTNTRSFADALRSALREDPDVILVGEMRDRETMQLAITAAETGHLVLSTLHTSNAGETVDRIVNCFPADHHELIRTSLAETLRAIVTQQLIPTVDGKRVAIRDVLLKNSAVANFIREGKLHQVDQAIISGRKEGMQSKDDDLTRLLKEGLISREVAFGYCSDKKVFLSSTA